MSNNAPYWSNGYVNQSNVGVITELLSAVALEWGGAIDPDGNALWYDVVRATSAHGSKLIYHGTSTGITDTTFLTDTDVYVEQGQSFYYIITVQDEYGLWAPGNVSSLSITRNLLTPAPFVMREGQSINSGTTSFICSRGMPSNLNSSTIFSYALSCDKVPVYNSTVDINETGSPSTIFVWKEGDVVPSTPYIKRSELIASLRASNYMGTLIFTLTTTNEYGTSKSTFASISVDMRVTPSWPTPNFQYSGGYTINGHQYNLPDVRAITLSWNAAIDELDGTVVTYDVQYRRAPNWVWNYVCRDITDTSITLPLPSDSVKVTYGILITAKLSNGNATVKSAPNIDIDRYLKPSIGLTNKKRNSTSVLVGLNISYNTTILSSDFSLSELAFLKCDGTTYQGLPTSSLTPSFTYGAAPYTDATFTKRTSYTMICRCKDSLGAIFGGSFANYVTFSTQITKYVPQLSVRKLGIGVNDINDGVGNYIMKIRGQVNTTADDAGRSGFYDNGARVTCPSILYHAANGLLINVAPVINNRMLVVRVIGNSYLGNQPYNSVFQVYHNISADAQPFISAYQVDSGAAIPGAKWINDGTYIYLWFPQPSGYSTFVVECFRQDIGFIKAVSVTSAAKPTGKELASIIVTNYVTAPNALANDISSTNINSLFKTGFYRGLSVTNAPDAGWWYFIVIGHDSSNWALQEATAYGSGNGVPAGTKYHRVCVAGTWGSWLAG